MSIGGIRVTGVMKWKDPTFSFAATGTTTTLTFTSAPRRVRRGSESAQRLARSSNP
jgi:hypothetical protein